MVFELKVDLEDEYNFCIWKGRGVGEKRIGYFNKIKSRESLNCLVFLG